MSQRVEYLNGLKGLCAISISVFHYLLAFAPFGYIGFSSGIEAENWFTYYFSYFPYSILSNASFPLYIFFALIGFFPAYHYFINHDQEWVKRQAIVRYFRFMPPIFICCLLVFVASQFKVFYAVELGQLLNNTFDLCFYTAPFNFLDAIQVGLFEALFRGEGTFNSVFWCMGIILTGSYIIYAILIFFGALRHRHYLYLIFFALSFYSPMYTAFLAGLVVADFLSQQHPFLEKKKEKYAFIALVIGLVCGFFPEVLLPWSGLVYTLYGVGSFFVLLAIGMSLKMQNILQHPFLTKCGDYSFSMIIAHFPLMYTFPSWLFIKAYGNGNYLFAIIVSFVSFILISAIGTVLFQKLVGRLPVFVSNKVYNFFK